MAKPPRKGRAHALFDASKKLSMTISLASSRKHDVPVCPHGARLEIELRKVKLLDEAPTVRDVTAGGLLDDEHVPVELFDSRGQAAAAHSYGGPTGERVVGEVQSSRSRCTARYEHSQEGHCS